MGSGFRVRGLGFHFVVPLWTLVPTIPNRFMFLVGVPNSNSTTNGPSGFVPFFLKAFKGAETPNDKENGLLSVQGKENVFRFSLGPYIETKAKQSSLQDATFHPTKPTTCTLGCSPLY